MISGAPHEEHFCFDGFDRENPETASGVLKNLYKGLLICTIGKPSLGGPRGSKAH